MVYWLSGCFVLLLILTYLNLKWTYRFAELVFREPPQVDDEQLPPAAVVLAMRGADPFLPNCLNGLMNQDYPDYDVHIIIDSKVDPAVEVVRQFLDAYEGENVQIHYLQDPLSTCSLKLSALIQVMQQLDDRYDVVTVLDADVITEPDWLRALVTPIVIDSQVGAASGIRWFMPRERELGNMIRRHWNICANTQMYRYQIPWGGSLAIRRSLLEQGNLFELWSHCLSEDTSLAQALEKTGHRLEMTPEAFTINRESINFSGSIRFIGRQQFFLHIHHPRWVGVMMIGILNAIAPLAATILFAVAVSQGSLLAWILPGAILLQCTSVMLQATITGKKVKKLLVSKGVHVRKSVFDYKTYTSAILSVFIHLWAVTRPFFVRELEWRGITYRRVAGNRFEMVQYRPYEPIQTNEMESHSI